MRQSASVNLCDISEEMIMLDKPVNNIDVKRRNRSNTLRCILNCEHISQMELTRRLKLSWPTVLQNVKELTEAGLVREVGTYESTGGRKAKAYAPIPDAKTALGLDITQNHVGIVLVDLGGQILRYTRKSQSFSTEDAWFESLSRLVDVFLKTNGEGRPLLGAGISLPGIVDEPQEYLRYSHVLGVKDFPTRKFRDALPFPCQFINDASAAGLAEIYGRPTDNNLIYLSLSNSIGGAVINGGSLYAGDNLRAGEFGHNTLVPGGRKCYCGKEGCLDAYCSARVLSSHTNGSLPDFFAQLYAKEPATEAVWQEYLEYLAVAVNNLRMSFDCDIIAGGYVGAFLEEFGAPLRKLLARRNTFEEDSSYFKTCRYKLEASAVGAALLQIDRFLRTL